MEPVANEISECRYRTFIGLPQNTSIILVEDSQHTFPPQKRGIADHDVGLRPFGFLALGRQNRVAAFDGVERFKNRITILDKPVAPHPLNLAYLYRDAGEFGGVGVDLDSLDVGGADAGKPALKAHRVGFELRAMLHVL